MTQDEQKQAVARAAIPYVVRDAWVGVGSGTTANFFIDELARTKTQIKGAVSSSVKSTQRLRDHGIAVVELNDVDSIPVYVDGADEVTAQGAMIKGGGGALTREKIVAAASAKFICIVDRSKLVPMLGHFPLPVEVIPMARNLVARALTALGGTPVLREGFTTDNGNVILDVAGLAIADPPALEDTIRAIAGVVTVGLFARRGADVILMGTAHGVETLQPESSAAAR